MIPPTDRTRCEVTLLRQDLAEAPKDPKDGLSVAIPITFQSPAVTGGLFRLPAGAPRRAGFLVLRSAAAAS